MGTAGSSTTSQWDFRNRDLAPPSHLPQLRQTSPLSRELTSLERPRSMADSLPTNRPTTTMTHSRSTSIFSFLKSNDNTPSTLPARTVEPNSQQSPQPDDLGRLVPNKRQPPLPSTSNGTLERTVSLQTSAPPQQLHPEIRSVVSLTHAHAHKVYMSGPLIRRIERLPDGHQPLKDEDWRDVWAQLGGTTLSIWDMKEIEEASKQGKEVPPTYINVTDAVSAIPNTRLKGYLITSTSLCKSSGPSQYLHREESLHKNITMS